MHRLIPAAVSLLLLAGCSTVNPRISEHGAEFAALDAPTQRNIRAGIIQPGYTTNMVYMAMGKPTQALAEASGQVVWLYRIQPVTAANETIQSGFRRRVVYDPVKRSNDVIVEPIDEKAFPHLVPHTIRVVFEDGRVRTVERINRG